MFGLEIGLTILLILCLIAACAFEFINGFHDTANAVATVIYTNSLKPTYAVVLSGTLNFLGVFAGGISVAMSIINLLPVESLIDQNVHHSVAMILALLLTAIIWNLGTWYYGIPCSSSHTMIGSILGVGIAFGFLKSDFSSVNWSKAGEVGLSLLVSPLFGFGMTVILMFVLRSLVRNASIFQAPPKDTPPPIWIRIILILTCSGVSFSHGSNDGQKGVGLVMLILIGIVPAYFALTSADNPQGIKTSLTPIAKIVAQIDESQLKDDALKGIQEVKKEIKELNELMDASIPQNKIVEAERFKVRKDILLISRTLDKGIEAEKYPLTKDKARDLKKALKDLRTHTDYAPFWVLLIISLSLGIGTMVGWKRIVVTIGEKIGKEHLTYAQGASSELVAAGTIGVSTFLGLPVSTTHVLSSGVAGSMVANRGMRNLQPKTIQNIALAWLLTLPVCIVMSAGLFLLFRVIL
ncbi:MAG: inorganic phosphate transporter [Microscillaceae bacterium]|jgi:PiT family inorganic phosphate transporter|nr:inorganic phosphate transporter [Microscillaceae bacterium]